MSRVVVIKNDLSAQIRNRLTFPKIALEILKDNKPFPKESLEKAIEELNEAIRLVSKMT